MAVLFGSGGGEVSRVAFCAGLVRILVMALGCCANLYSLPYDTSATGSNGVANWDGVYFEKIVHSGYEFEQVHAFFPGLPLLFRMSGLSKHGDLGIALFINTCTVFASVMFYYLSVEALASRALALRAALLFCVSPAGIFFSSFYTESPFALLSFAGMWAMTRSRRPGAHRTAFRVLAALCFAVATSIRSNGVILAGYLVYDAIVMAPRRSSSPSRPRWLLALLLHLLSLSLLLLCTVAPFLLFQRFGARLYCELRQPPRPWCHGRRFPNMYGFIQSRYWGVGFLQYYTLKQLPNFLLASPMIALTALGCRCYARALLASIRLHLRATAGRSGSESGSGSGSGVAAAWRRWLCSAIQVSLFPSQQQQHAAVTNATPADVLKTDSSDNSTQRQQQRPPSEQQQQLAAARSSYCTVGFGSVHCLPFVLQWCAMAAVAVTVMHVQVITRFLASSCPPLYWYAASITVAASANSSGGGVTAAADGQYPATGNSSKHAATPLPTGAGGVCHPLTPTAPTAAAAAVSVTLAPSVAAARRNLLAVLAYFLGYTVVGTILFRTFYPWT